MSYDKSVEDCFKEIENEMKENGYKTKNQKKRERKKSKKRYEKIYR